MPWSRCNADGIERMKDEWEYWRNRWWKKNYSNSCQVSYLQCVNSNWEMERSENMFNNMTTYGKAASERTSEKRSQNESKQIVIFHLYWWNMVRCICAINHSVSAMIHLQQQTVHLLRLFWIQWCCIASKTQTTKIYALAFSTLILPKFFSVGLFFSFTFRYTYIVCIKCIQFILCSWSKRVKKKIQFIKNPTIFQFFT